MERLLLIKEAKDGGILRAKRPVIGKAEEGHPRKRKLKHEVGNYA